MILVDAVYINNSGGKNLLDYLICEIEKTNHLVFYLLDDRIKHNHQFIKSTNKVKYLKGGFLPRFIFYFTNKVNYRSILCFGNFPPPIKQRVIVYTYFHQLLFINPSKDDSLYFRFMTNLKVKLFILLSNNCDYWIVQTSSVKKSLYN